MRPGVRADGVAGGRDLLEDFRMIGRVLADREEHRLGAFVRKRLEHRRRVVGHGPSSKVSTTSLSARKSNCLYCWKPKPGPPVVSITTMRLTPSASGLAQAISAAASGAGAAAPAFDSAAGDLDVVLGGELGRGGSGQRLGIAGGDGLGGPRRRAAKRSRTRLRRSQPPQQHWPASGPTHYASLLLSKYSGTHITRRAINANKVLTPHQHGPVPARKFRRISLE